VHRTRVALSLDSDLVTVIDDVAAYRAVLDAIRSLDPERAAAFRRTIVSHTSMRIRGNR